MGICTRLVSLGATSSERTLAWLLRVSPSAPVTVTSNRNAMSSPTPSWAMASSSRSTCKVPSSSAEASVSAVKGPALRLNDIDSLMKVPLVGNRSSTTRLSAGAPPVLSTVTSNVTVSPGCTIVGLPTALFAICRSGPSTVVWVVFDSKFGVRSLSKFAVFSSTVPAGVIGLMVTWNVKLNGPLGASRSAGPHSTAFWAAM